MSYNEWKHGLISDEEYADEYILDKMREARFGAVENEEEDDEGEDCEGENVKSQLRFRVMFE